MDYKININLIDVTQKSFEFSDVRELLLFAREEHKFWTEKKNFLGSIGRESTHMGFLSHLNNMVEVLSGFESTWHEWDQAALNANLNQHHARWQKALKQQWLWKGHPFIDVWMDAYRLSNPTGNAFYEFYIQKTAGQSNTPDALRGYILAAEYQIQGLPDFTTRLKSEDLAFERLRSDLYARKTELFEEIKADQEGVKAWKEAFDNKTQEDIAAFNKESSEQVSAQNKIFESYTAEWKQRKQELEETYADKLKLEKPAEYWKKRAKELHNQAMLWVFFLILSLTVGVVAFLWLFYGWVVHEKLPFSLLSLQGAIIFATAISAYVFLIKTFSRLAFSSFHLQRDAEEREQLAYLYLALSKEGAVDKDSLSIVLQALFSRSESGLLLKESGPTMPITELTKMASRGGGS